MANKKIIYLTILFLVFMVVFLGFQQEKTAKFESFRDGCFFHITHGTDDPHRAIIPLRIAEYMAEVKDVFIFFDIKGIDVVLKGNDIEFSQTSSLTQLKKLMDKNVPIYACRVSLETAGKSEKDLIEGVKILTKKDLQETFFNFTKGRILTLNY